VGKTGLTPPLNVLENYLFKTPSNFKENNPEGKIIPPHPDFCILGA